MTTKYFALLTATGAALLANATALGRQLQITQMALGDGGGTLPTPDPAQTKLVNECRRAPLNSLSVDPANTNQIIAEQVIPEDEGGWWIREIGLYDASGNLIAIANCPETYKPKLQEGSGRVQTVRMILIVSSTDAVTLKIDPSVVLATRSYANAQTIDAKAYADNQVNNARADLKTYTDNSLAAHSAAVNPHKQYAPLASPALTGVPTAPTAAAGTNNSQLATTAFVTAAANNTSASVLAMTAANLAKKLDIADIAGIPLPWPQASAPAGWLKCNGQAFDKTLYPKLAQVYPSGTLPDLRGEFIRGWDDGRGVDAGRALLSGQSDAVQDHGHGDMRYSGQGAGGGNLPIVDGGAAFNGGGDLIGAISNRAFNGAPRVAAETRPRNIAFNYIVRAA
ncbi:phage tail protein [Dickeya lacustris]|uniref:Phage tail protein n=1 Tax=Dickeya lacustris TaxID=2259638 RepID=A0ABY8G6C8_9GAMM|nr:phage tail protein [Dickeya lacustris]WFN55512.1 phage tail protein [Dickeya lacustris]